VWGGWGEGGGDSQRNQFSIIGQADSQTRQGIICAERVARDGGKGQTLRRKVINEWRENRTERAGRCGHSAEGN